MLLVIGLVLVGAAFLLLAEAEQSELSCTVPGEPAGGGCESTLDNDANDTITDLGLIGGGIIVAGVGAGVVAAAVIEIMARRERDFLGGPPGPGFPPGPSPGYPVSGPVPPLGTPPPLPPDLPGPPFPP